MLGTLWKMEPNLKPDLCASLHGPPLDAVAEPHDAVPGAVEEVPLAAGDPLERRHAALRDERRLRRGGARRRRRPHLV